MNIIIINISEYNVFEYTKINKKLCLYYILYIYI